MADPLIVARHGDLELALLPSMANRHGLITGATGTGKTISLQVLAEQFSRIGVPVFMADVKGSRSASTSSACRNPPGAAARSRCGTSGASRATRSARPSRTWGRCSSRGSST